MEIDNRVEDIFFGAVKVGERGQVVIPAEARRLLDLSPGVRLLVFKHPFGSGLSLVKVEAVHDMLARMAEHLDQVRSAASSEQDETEDGSDD